jgi:hypothetical protein
VARAFLAGYLARAHAGESAGAAADATVQLRRALARPAATVTPDEPVATPRLLALGVSGGRAGEVALLGLVADGRETYTVALTVKRARSGRWLVSAVW